jgi:hypothetical protein
MNPEVPTINLVIDLVVVVALIGLMVIGRWRLSVFFAAYLLWVLVRDILQNFWWERFYFQRFWLIGQSALDILKFGIALEVAWRTFGPFPGAADAAKKAAVLVLGLTAVSVASVPLANPQSTVFETAITTVHPRLNDGTIWLMAAILAIAKWYRVPLHRFHAAVLTGLALYLFFFTSILRIFVGRDLQIIRYYFNVLDPVGFGLVTCWWVRVAWRSESGEDRIHMGTLKALQVRGVTTASGPSL